MDAQGLVSLAPWTIIAQLLNLLITMLLVKKFLLKPINEVLEKRKAKADAEIQDAVKAREEAEALKAEYESSMSTAREKASEIVSTAQKAATVQTEEMLQEASRQAAAIKEKAEADIALEKRKAATELKDEIGAMAMEIAGKVIEREIREEDHEKLIDEFIANVGETS